MRFCCINDGVTSDSVNLLRAACERRGVEFIEIQARAFLFHPDSQLLPGNMLYCPAISPIAHRVEQFLAAPNVASFHANYDHVLFVASNFRVIYQRAGIPIPRAIPLASTNRDIIRDHVRSIGGFPVIVKIDGRSTGVGTIKVDSFPTLFSLLDYLIALGHCPLLCAFIDDAVYWRLIVIGDRVVASHRANAQSDDFRCHGSDNIADFVLPLPEGAATLAVRAVKALGLEFGGVDILQHSSGRLFVLESNFPCYFATAQLVAGVDVAGMMVDYLITKSRALIESSSIIREPPPTPVDRTIATESKVGDVKGDPSAATQINNERPRTKDLDSLDVSQASHTERMSAADPVNVMQSTQQNPKVAVYAICHNEEQFVDRMIGSCLEADLIVIVDFGSTDSTWEKLQAWAKQRPDQIQIHQAWVDPWRFDVARDVSLAMVPLAIDVCISLDLDEVLLAGWREALNTAWFPMFQRGSYRYVYSWVNDGEPDLVFWATKVHARQGYHWYQPVHELPRRYAGPEVQTEIPGFFINHYPDVKKSRRQYLPLLEFAALENPNDDRSAHYLGREYMICREWEKGIRELERHLSLESHFEAERATSMRFLSQAYLALGQPREAEKYLKMAVDECPELRETWVDLAQFCFNQGDFELTVRLCLRALKISERPKTYYTYGRYYRDYPHDLLASAALKTADNKLALEHIKEALTYEPNKSTLIERLQMIEQALCESEPAQ
jgi:tetratricopeptide (TPR) repeat protein